MPHNQSGGIKCGETHTACDKRIKKEGDKTRCCYCVPHEGCELNKPQPTVSWEEEFDRQFENFYDMSDEEFHYKNLKSFIASTVAQAERKAVNEYKKSLGHYGYADIVEKHHVEVEQNKLAARQAKGLLTPEGTEGE